MLDMASVSEVISRGIRKGDSMSLVDGITDAQVKGLMERISRLTKQRNEANERILQLEANLERSTSCNIELRAAYAAVVEKREELKRIVEQYEADEIRRGDGERIG